MGDESRNPLPRLLLVQDPRLSRERTEMLMRQLQSLRRLAQVEILREPPEEAKVLERLDRQPCQLLLLPWHLHLSWHRVEAHFGITRLRGPTSAGYIAEPLYSTELEHASEGFNRSLLVDTLNLRQGELSHIFRSVLHDELRTGIRPWLESRTPSYFEAWYSGHGLGYRLDQCLKIPGSAEWAEARGTPIRLAITALWALVYEEGPGKSELINNVHARVPKASFQVACDEKAYVLRLGYRQRGRSPAQLVRQFRHDSMAPSHPAQLLIKHADLVRVQVVPETGDTEVTVVFFPSAVAETHPDEAHSIWVAPIASSLLIEKFYQEPTAGDPLLLPLPLPANLVPGQPPSAMNDRAQYDKRIYEAAIKVRDLRETLAQREEEIRELRAGGVGLPQEWTEPAGSDDLIDALRDRLQQDAQAIEDLEAQLASLETTEPGSLQAVQLKRRLAELRQQEQERLAKLQTLSTHRAPGKAAA